MLCYFTRYPSSSVHNQEAAVQISQIPDLLMAGRLALRLVDKTAVRLSLRPSTVSLDVRRRAGGSATNPAPAESVRTEADLPHISLPTLLYRLIVKGYYNQVHELQVWFS